MTHNFGFAGRTITMATAAQVEAKLLAAVLFWLDGRIRSRCRWSVSVNTTDLDRVRLFGKKTVAC